MLDKSGIYKIVNIANDRVYYGSAKNLKKRKYEHFKCLKRICHGNKFLQRDFTKSGAENFLFKVILLCDKKNLIFYEQKFLDAYFDNCDTCYNMCPIAHNTLGRKVSFKTRCKISYKLKGKNYLSDEQRKRIASINSKKQKGKNNSQYNSEIYTFFNIKTNTMVKCTRYDLQKKYNLNDGGLWNIFNLPNRTTKGWKLITD